MVAVLATWVGGNVWLIEPLKPVVALLKPYSTAEAALARGLPPAEGPLCVCRLSSGACIPREGRNESNHQGVEHKHSKATAQVRAEGG